MGRSYRPSIGARGIIGIMVAVVDECSVSKAVMYKCQLSVRRRHRRARRWLTECPLSTSERIFHVLAVRRLLAHESARER